MSPPTRDATVLIASESPADLAPLTDELGREGVKVAVATKADHALALLADGSITLALIDIGMRQRDGFELCRLIRSADATAAIPVLLLGASLDLDQRQHSADAGASDYIARPFDPRQLIDKVQQLLALHQTDVNPLSLMVNYHALLSGSPDTVVLLDIQSGKLIDVNGNACALFGVSERELLGKKLVDLCPPTQANGERSQALLDSYIERVSQGLIQVLEAEFVHSSGRRMTCELRLVIMPTPSRRLMHVRMMDVTNRNRAERLRLGQARLLEMIARGAPLKSILDELLLLIESLSPGAHCTVLLLDQNGKTVHPIAAPSLPPEFIAAFEGLSIGSAAGSCGRAMFLREMVITANIETDPLWDKYRQLAQPYGLRACWSTPIVLDGAGVLGSFAVYYREVRTPDEEELRLIEVVSHLAAIAIERTRREEELKRHRDHLEELVSERTEELTSALATLSLTQEELVRRDKLAALGTLVAGVAHELNTPIGNSLVIATTMAEHAQALEQDIAAGLRRSRLNSYLERAHEASDILVRNLHRAARLVSSFKQLAVDRTTSQRRIFSVSELLDELVLPLRISIRKRPIAVELVMEPGLTMDSYPGPLSQALSNLFENCLVHAFDADAEGSIRISAVPVSVSELAISIADTGHGIAPEVAARVYDPFYTTKLGSGGSGLGLHVAHNIVTGILGGKIDLHSVPGSGTTFTLTLPRVAPNGQGANPAL
ncbi:response regulator [Massilia sp. PAMC28688]|uniref:ATP-binding protein n=1 Tax=Massilia sp. PAMC28688 TaxID=2861283 RepID=UPI001C627FE0|nr:ATP-binding protein [Massilia sp. PAMC28688]QYF96219.1 response regulator [Massilia sp. PAMC28688]